MDPWNENVKSEGNLPASSEPVDGAAEPTEAPQPAHEIAEGLPTAPWQADAPGMVLQEESGAAAATPHHRGGGHGALVAAFALLMMATIGVGIVAMKLWFDRSNAQTALRVAVSAVSAAGPGGDEAARKQLAAADEAIERGQFTEVAERLRRLVKASPVSPAHEDGLAAALPGGIPGLPGFDGGSGDGATAKGDGSSDDEIARKTGLPPEAIAFFRAHQELGQVFGQANQAALALKKSGGNVARLRTLRNEIISAARLNDEARVKQLLDDFAKEFAAQGQKLAAKRSGGRGGRPGGPVAGRRSGGAPPALMQLVGRVSEVMQDAQASGKDISTAIETMRRAEMAGRAGNFALAEKLARQAMRQAQTARKVPPQPELFRNPIVSMCLNLMRVEDRELSSTLQAVRQTLAEAGKASVQRLRDTLKATADTISGLGKRRTGFGRTLQLIGTGKESAPALQTPEQAEAALRQRAQTLRQVISEALTRAQGMAAQEFTTTGRDQLAEAVLQAVFGPPPSRPADQPQKPASAAQERPTDVRDRVQAKLLAAAKPYLEVCAQPDQQVKAKLLAATFAEARRLLSAGDLSAAESKTDEGLKLLGIDPASVGPGTGPQEPSVEAAPQPLTATAEQDVPAVP